jgi:hypothetical protein
MNVLALATLSDATRNRNDPISAAPPKVAKASCHASLSLVLSPANVANVNKPYLIVGCKTKQGRQSYRYLHE